jgi:hypothetical protein
MMRRMAARPRTVNVAQSPSKTNVTESADLLRDRLQVFIGTMAVLLGALYLAGALVEVCGHHLHTEPQPPSQRASQRILEELERLILSCLNKRPEDRPTSAESLEREPDQLKQQHPWTLVDAASWWSEWRRGRPSTLTAASNSSPFANRL